MFSSYNPESSKITTSLPLLLVFIINIIRKGLEDIKRHRADYKQNNKSVLVLERTNSHFIEKPWHSLKPGDIIKIHKYESIPSDIIILKTSEEDFKCFVETADLDGETNLKKRESNCQIEQNLGLSGKLSEEELLRKLKEVEMRITYENPSSNLYSFSGKIEVNDKIYSISVNHTIWRGCNLRCCDWIIGITVYTGSDTRIMHSSKKSPIKQSNVYKTVNMLIFLIFGLELVAILVSTVCYMFFAKNLDMTYLHLDGNNKSSFSSFITFLILYNNFVPISLYVSLDFVKYFQSLYMEGDNSMMDQETGTSLKVRTAEINENLGQVKYIFSDKTGTITRNVMELKKIIVNDEIYGLLEEEIEVREKDKQVIYDSPLVTFYDTKLLKDLYKNKSGLNDFFILLSLCHTVVPEYNSNDEVEYRASSPDEVALIQVKQEISIVCFLLWVYI